MQKQKFGVTCPGELLLGPTPGPLENEKKCVDVSHLQITWNAKKQVRRHVSQGASIGTRIEPTRE
jgi:hypothetical protein